MKSEFFNNFLFNFLKIVFFIQKCVNPKNGKKKLGSGHNSINIMCSNGLKIKYFFIDFFKIKNYVFINNSLFYHKILIFIFKKSIQKVDFDTSKKLVFN